MTSTLMLIVLLFLIGISAAAPQDGSSAPRPRTVLGAACECRCCWKSAGDRRECNARFHEFLLRPEQCGVGCTAVACTAHFGETCAPTSGALQATCRRAAPRVLTLLFFLGAAIALLAFAMLRSTPRDDPDNAEVDELSRRGSYFSDASQYGSVHMKMASDIPFIVPPEGNIVVRHSTPLNQ